jgi:hypothetical protein
MKAVLPLPQRHWKSVVEHPAASAPWLKQGIAHVGSWETRPGSDVELVSCAAITAAKNDSVKAANCIVSFRVRDRMLVVVVWLWLWLLVLFVGRGRKSFFASCCPRSMTK